MRSQTLNGRSNKKKHSESHIGSVIDGAESLLAATADLGEDKLVNLREKLQAELELAREQLEKAETQLKERMTSVDDYVHENPWQAVGVAAAAGMIVGALAFRK